MMIYSKNSLTATVNQRYIFRKQNRLVSILKSIFYLNIFLSLAFPKTVQAQPKLTVKSPIGYTVAHPTINIDATCTQSSSGLPKIEVYLFPGYDPRTFLISGLGKINKTLDMTSYFKAYPRTHILIVCKDSFGKSVEYERIIFIETSTKIKEVRTVGGWIWDADENRILYEHDKKIMLHERSTWRNIIIYNGFKLFGNAFLPSNGVVFDVETNSGCRKYHWLNGKLITLCANNTLDMRVRGNYALFSCNSGLILRNLLKGTNTIITNVGDMWNLALNGDVCFSRVDPTKNFWMLFRYRNGKENHIANGKQCMIDSKNVMYQKSPATQTTLALFSNASEIVLAKDQGTRTYAQEGQYFVNNGWSSYTVDNGSGTYQLYVRSPGGKTTMVTKSSTSVSSIAALGKDGEVWFYRNGLYYVEVGKSPSLICDTGYPIYIGTQWHVRIGRSLFMVRAYSQWPDGGTGPPDMGPPDYGPLDYVTENIKDSVGIETGVDSLAFDTQINDKGNRNNHNGNGGCTGCSYGSEIPKNGMEIYFYMLILFFSLILRKRLS
jgi:hypothetical protein